MAKRGDPNKKNNKLERQIKINWIICIASLAAILALTFFTKFNG